MKGDVSDSTEQLTRTGPARVASRIQRKPSPTPAAASRAKPASNYDSPELAASPLLLFDLPVFGLAIGSSTLTPQRGLSLPTSHFEGVGVTISSWECFSNQSASSPFSTPLHHSVSFSSTPFVRLGASIFHSRRVRMTISTSGGVFFFATQAGVRVERRGGECACCLLYHLVSRFSHADECRAKGS